MLKRDLLSLLDYNYKTDSHAFLSFFIANTFMILSFCDVNITKIHIDGELQILHDNINFNGEKSYAVRSV